jgi:hypothetical protein
LGEVGVGAPDEGAPSGGDRTEPVADTGPLVRRGKESAA